MKKRQTKQREDPLTLRDRAFMCIPIQMGVIAQTRVNIVDAIEATLEEVREETIEECAKVIDRFYLQIDERKYSLSDIANDIRSLSAKEKSK